MSRRLMGIVTGVALGTAAVVGLWPAPVSADGCGQECGTQYNQCIFPGGEISDHYCQDWGVMNRCEDVQTTTCGEVD